MPDMNSSSFSGKGSIAEDDVKYLKGVGPKRAEALATVGVKTQLDLLYYFPRRYLDRSRILKIKDAQSALLTPDEVTFVGRIKSLYVKRGGRQFLFAKLADETGTMRCVWFNGVQYFIRAFKEGELIAFSGKVTTYQDEPCLIHPDYDYLEDESDEEFLHTGGIIPVYPATEGLRRVGMDSRGLRRIIRNFLESRQDYEFPDDILPAEVLSTNSLMNFKDAAASIHFPKDERHLGYSQRRFKFEELFYLELLLGIRRNLTKLAPGIQMSAKKNHLVGKLTNEILPFKLTDSQKKVLQEIFIDLKSSHPMQRLLQGDVGSGKTIVALIAILIAVENGYQTAFMAPTEILAAQHFATVKQYVDLLGIKSAMLIGGQKKGDRTQIYSDIEDGSASIVVGTHALIQEKVKFNKLGLIVVDEQHRFGVVQRMALQGKGENPHLLVMTATPIPRTLSLTIYGDLDVSVIDEMPGGRKKIKTALRSESQRESVYKFIREQVLAGQQIFFVYPLVNETEKLDLKAATQSFVRLRDEVFRGFKVGLIHGQMTETEKNDIMLAFKKNAINILAATTVIEVGIDVPNATVMVVEHAERFGLSQLHQLRGRIGRGVHQSYCILMTDEKYLDEKKIRTREDAVAYQRLRLFTSTSDGFKIAEYDLEIRGPGEFFGTKQSGVPPLKLADLIKDRDLIIQARRSAFRIAERDPHLREGQHAKLRETLLKNYRESFEFLKAS
ncbi:MAG TPA: ATP-dependent DNA helicase RecG [Candidatus Acidoferrales bacterium]|nr:ATP-dependent DNA helicase RecG [Candidatus Acidoferrales bacterium]